MLSLPITLNKRAAAAGGHRGSRAGIRGQATAGLWAPRPPGRQLETSGLGGAARANGQRQLAKPVVAGLRTGHDSDRDRPQGVPPWHQ